MSNSANIMPFLNLATVAHNLTKAVDKVINAFLDEMLTGNWENSQFYGQ